MASQPDGLTLIKWHGHGGKPMMWDVTTVSTLAVFYLHATSHSAGGTVETASARKVQKYHTQASHHNIPRLRITF